MATVWMIANVMGSDVVRTLSVWETPVLETVFQRTTFMMKEKQAINATLTVNVMEWENAPPRVGAMEQPDTPMIGIKKEFFIK